MLHFEIRQIQMHSNPLNVLRSEFFAQFKELKLKNLSQNDKIGGKTSLSAYCQAVTFLALVIFNTF